MGQTFSPFVYHYITNPDTAPDVDNPPTFDPLIGFPDGRKERVMVATKEQMIAANLPLDKRDYCAHLWIEYIKCRKEKLPFAYRCHHEKHIYDKCQYDDYVLRMKEYERERRLKERAKRREEKRTHELLVE